MSIVYKRPEVLCGLERPERQPAQKVFRQCRRRNRVRRTAEGECSPKTARGGPSVETALARFAAPTPNGSAIQWAARTLIQTCGSQKPAQLAIHNVEGALAALAKVEAASTKSVRANALRRALRYLALNYGAKDLSGIVGRSATPRPRNVVATIEERQKLIKEAAPYMKCWLLLCSDLAIRSGTAATLGPSNYDAKTRTLIFTTKYQSKQQLPVTAELAALLDQCLDPALPFVAQLPRENAATANRAMPYQPLGHLKRNSLSRAFRILKKRCGITRDLRPHDMRRATATRIYDATRDLRVVQAILGHADLGSTLYYLDHHVTPVDVSTLELAKLNPTTEAIQ